MDCDILFKIIVIGSSGTGKSNLILRYASDQFSRDPRSTLGVEFASKSTEIRVFRYSDEERIAKQQELLEQQQQQQQQLQKQEQEKLLLEQQKLEKEQETKIEQQGEQEEQDQQQQDGEEKSDENVSTTNKNESSSDVVEAEATTSEESSRAASALDEQVVVRIKSQLWDTAGQDRFRAITTAFYRGAHGALICYDITNRQSFDDLEEWLLDLAKTGETECINMLVGTKSDLAHIRAVPTAEAKEFAERHNMYFLETSALNNANVDIAFDHMIHSLFEKNRRAIMTPRGNGLAFIPSAPNPSSNDVIEIHEPAQVRSGGWCFC